MVDCPFSCSLAGLILIHRCLFFSFPPLGIITLSPIILRLYPKLFAGWAHSHPPLFVFRVVYHHTRTYHRFTSHLHFVLYLITLCLVTLRWNRLIVLTPGSLPVSNTSIKPVLFLLTRDPILLHTALLLLRLTGGGWERSVKRWRCCGNLWISSSDQ
jgi:hypothetical protein